MPGKKAGYRPASADIEAEYGLGDLNHSAKSGSEKAEEPAPHSKQRSRVRCIFCYRWWTPILWVIGLLALAVAIAAPIVMHEKPWRAEDPDLLLLAEDVAKPFVDVDFLTAAMASAKGVTVLDARPPPSTFATAPGLGRTIPGAVRAQWHEFMDGSQLRSADEVAEIFRQKGVFNDRPVVIYGGWSASKYWGEEGRLFWQLNWLNHTSAHVLYGGIWAWDDDIHKGSGVGKVQGDFVASPVDKRIVDLDELVAAVKEEPESIFVLDARDTGEFEGSTPFGSSYGGHVPGAKNVPWRSVFDENGDLLPKENVRQMLVDMGFRNGMKLVTYCTRGVRSGFLYTVLVWAGFDASNYAGSWREWSAQIPKGEFDGM